MTIVKKISLHLLVSVLALSGVTGCVTSSLWKSYDKTDYKESTTESEKIIGFGVAKENKAPLRKDGLIIIGEKFWYVLDEYTQNNTNLRELLELPVTQPYDFCSKPEFSLRYQRNNDRPPEFSIALNCLVYRLEPSLSPKEQIDRIAFLTQRGFGEVIDSQGEKIWKKVIRIHGEAYSASHSLPQFAHTFDKSIEAQVTHIVPERRSVGGAVARVLATPFTLAADAVAGVVLVPFAALAGRLHL